MRQQLVDQLNQLVKEVAEEIQPLLPKHHKHPNGRIATAHIYDVIKNVLHAPMKECRDCRYDDIVKIIMFCRDHARDYHIVRQLRPLFEPEPRKEGGTLEDFF